MITPSNTIAILIPAFNEAKTIVPIVSACLRYSSSVTVVDDGSTDSTPEILAKLPIQFIRHNKNKGKSASLRDGFLLALGNPQIEAVITLDADNQHDPIDITRFIQLFKKNRPALVIGARTENTEHAPKYRLWANKTADFFISKAAGKKIIDTQSGYRLYPRKVLEQVLPGIKHYDSFTFETEILIDAARAGFDLEFLAIKSYYPPDLRPSRFKPLRDTWKITKLITRKLLRYSH